MNAQQRANAVLIATAIIAGGRPMIGRKPRPSVVTEPPIASPPAQLSDADALRIVKAEAKRARKAAALRNWPYREGHG